MIIDTSKELKNLKRSGRVIRQALDAMSDAVKPGISTLELDLICKQILDKTGAKSAPPRVYNFPGQSCISVNDEALHGIPSKDRILAPGDLVKLDLVASLHGWFTDACVTVSVPGIDIPENQKLIECAQKAFQEALNIVRPGILVGDLGTIIGEVVQGYGFDTIEDFGGHGVGKTIHESPFVPNRKILDLDPIELKEGQVFTIEPIVCSGNGAYYKKSDGWTIVTKDGGNVAHYEQTVVIWEGKGVIVTDG